MKKFGAIASTALLIGVPAVSLGYVVEKLPGKIFHVYNDFDLDDIPNSWEDAHGLNKWDHSDAKNDFDHDGYTNLQEYLLGLDPKNPDCDGDGLLDGDDPDRDNMTSWFERNIAHLDPLTPNDRYVLLINPVKFDLGIFDGVISKLVSEEMDKQYDFFHNKMRIPKQNIIDLRYPNATYENFVKAVDKISNISDENDIVYISLNGHGGYDLFFFNGDDSNSIQFYEDIIYFLDKIPSKEQYLQIGSCHSGSAIEEIKSLGSGSLRGGCPWKFG
ncbi:MAG: hypothetical protein J7L45_00125, partial [Candidatus Aenigmarchaeota archaeon]|nr:hypothetical protein [Candidatus Aenigmarchaeota archaeon]